MGIVEHLDALYFVFLGVDDAQDAVVASLQDVTHDGTTWLVDVVRPADDSDGLRL